MNMDATEALKFIRPLAEGINPCTGEIFPQQSPYQNPSIIRALYSAIDVLEKESKRELRKKDEPQRAGKPWTEEEEKKLLQYFDTGTPIKNIAQKHQRTPYAVMHRLYDLGKVPESELSKYAPVGRETKNL